MQLTKILTLKNITCSFDGLKAIDSLNLDIEAKRISAIIGPNGAGKTTLFNLICGFIYPNSGKIMYNGNDITNLNPWKRASSGIGRLFQDIRVFKKLTPLENLLVTFNDDSENPLKAVLGKGNKKEKIEKAVEWLKFIGLLDRKDSLAENLSWGQQKLLSLARLLCGDFNLLLIDEPTSGVNPDMASHILEKIKGLKNLDKTIVIVEHDMDVVKTVSDYVYYMDSGKITASGLPEEVLNKREIVEPYIRI